MKAGTRTKAPAAQPPMPSSLATEAKRLDGRDQRAYSSQFGHDFSQVRIYDGPRSGALAQSMGARGVAVPGSVVLAPGTDRRPDTLGHELAHIAQMEREGPDQGRGSAEREARSAAKGQQTQLHAAASSAYLDDDDKKPPAAAPVADPAATPAAPTTLPTPAIPTPLLPTATGTSGYQLPPNFWGTQYNLKPPAPLFTPGAGPATPRPGTGGDILGAVTKIPAVANMLMKTEDKATGDLGKIWQSDWLTKLAVGTTGASMAALLAMPLINPKSRDAAAGAFPYSLLQGAKFPIGPAAFQFNLAGKDKNFQLMLDLAKLIKVLQ